MSKMITLTQIAKQLKMSPKVARRKLRDAGIKKSKEGWVFKASQRASIIKTVRA